jgi:nitrate reductase gamma subunit
MAQWLEWARGPFFRFSFAILLLGLLRIILLHLLNIALIIHQARQNKRKIPYKKILGATLKWLFPFSPKMSRQIIFVITSILFHLSLIVVPLFLSAHILLWERGLGLRWPALEQNVADILTIVAIFTGLAILVQRSSTAASRSLSRPQDYFFLSLILLLFLSGYLAAHPALHPFRYHSVMLVHVLTGNLLFILTPFSKLSHIVLFPLTQLVSELGWYLNYDSGQKVSLALGKENEPI